MKTNRTIVFIASVLAAAVSAQEMYATCQLRDDAASPESISGRFLLRQSAPDSDLLISGFIGGFQAAGTHPIAITDFPTTEANSCASTGGVASGLGDYTSITVEAPSPLSLNSIYCYNHVDSIALLQDSDSFRAIMNLSMTVFDSPALLEKLACCNIQ